MDGGTGQRAKVPGITVCGKTGTVENYYRGVKQPNHSFFCAFAPRENPQIAIMCVVENSGRFGGTYAAPIVSLMIEKYLNDTIDAKRKPLEESMANTNLIPPLMLEKMRIRDSLENARAMEKSLKNELSNIKDTLMSEDNLTEAEASASKNKNKSNSPAKDTQNKKQPKTDMLLPDKQKQPAFNQKDTVKR